MGSRTKTGRMTASSKRPQNVQVSGKRPDTGSDAASDMTF
jgi:hypothetical protein